MISMKIHRSSFEVLVAGCDPELVGKKFSDGKLNLNISKDFYEDVIVEDDDFLKQLNFATIANLVGENVIKKAIEAGIVDEDCVITICDVPHAQVAVQN